MRNIMILDIIAETMVIVSLRYCKEELRQQNGRHIPKTLPPSPCRQRTFEDSGVAGVHRLLAGNTSAPLLATP